MKDATTNLTIERQDADGFKVRISEREMYGIAYRKGFRGTFDSLMAEFAKYDIFCFTRSNITFRRVAV